MNKNIYLTIALCLILSLTAAAQDIVKPTLTPTVATPEQKQLIDEGIKLHDQKQYDQAIAKYDQVLKENPNNDEALYEIALSYYNKKDMPNALNAAYKLIKYRSDTGVLGYGLIANVMDDTGKPKEAIEIYQKSIKQLEGDVVLQPHISELYYNLAITYFRQKLYKDSRESLKRSVAINFRYASPNYLLAVVYQGTKYKVPSMLAAARLISLEQNTKRSEQAVAIFLSALNSPKKDDKTGNINITLDINAPKDEGDFGMYDLLLGTLTTVKDEKDKNKSQNEIFAEAVDSLIALLSEDKNMPSTFVGKTYIPFMADMKKLGFSKPFAYLILQQSGNREAGKWLNDNSQQAMNFLNWAKTYQLKR